MRWLGSPTGTCTPRRRFLAETLGDRKYLEVLKAIKVIADFRRHLPRDFGEIRYNMLKDMWDDARDKWGDEIGQKVYDAF